VESSTVDPVLFRYVSYHNIALAMGNEVDQTGILPSDQESFPVWAEGSRVGLPGAVKRFFQRMQPGQSGSQGRAHGLPQIPGV
jgi:hypothetical protein